MKKEKKKKKTKAVSLNRLWEIVTDREIWCTAVCGVTKSWTRWGVTEQQSQLSPTQPAATHRATLVQKVRLRAGPPSRG